MTFVGTQVKTTQLLKVPFMEWDQFDPGLMPQHAISFQLWSKATLSDCVANFSIAHFNNGICIHYNVYEPYLKTKTRKPNGDVHRDNCVEFFINLNKEDAYYNFEFNCLGSVKAGYGNNRVDREQLPAEVLKQIEDQISISINNLNKSKFIQWEATIIIPHSAFYQHKIQSLRGLTCCCNFTKCGDDLPVPHYLSWVKIEGETPDFHQPLSFREVRFE
jgi:hypothetical protein